MRFYDFILNIRWVYFIRLLNVGSPYGEVSNRFEGEVMKAYKLQSIV